jgi:RNA polymerase sigma-70 factor (ECF subfamily)
LSNLEGAVARFLNGETAAFQELVDATSARLVRLGARMLGNMADAEDVVQEAYVKAYRSLLDGQFDRRAKVETWLYRIVVNTAIDARRKRARREPALELSEDTLPAGDSPVEARLALAELADWLGALPPDQQAALVLKVVEGRESAEIAEILGCSEGAVEQRLVRARAALRQRRSDS